MINEHYPPKSVLQERTKLSHLYNGMGVYIPRGGWGGGCEQEREILWRRGGANEVPFSLGFLKKQEKNFEGFLFFSFSFPENL